MTNPSSDSYRNVTKYLGQDYSFAPRYIRPRDPLSPTNASGDIKPKEQQGYYPLGSLWTNSSNGNLWVLANIVSNLGKWILITSGSSGPLLKVAVDANTAPGTNPVIPDLSGQITIEGGSTFASNTQANPIRTNSLAANKFDLQIQLAGSNAGSSSANKFGVSQFDSNQFTVTNGFVQITGGGSVLETLSDDVNAIVTPTSNNIQLVGHVVEAGATKFSTVTAGSHLLNINPMSSARWIVDPLGFNGTHTTIGSALTSASSGDTIFIMGGTYTENLTIKAGVNLVAYVGDSWTPNVTIIGKLSASFSGTCSIANIYLQTNSDNILAITGSAATIINLNNCYINATNNTAISSTTTNTGSKITFTNCQGNLGTTGIAYFSSAHSTINLYDSLFYNSGSSTTASTFTNDSNLNIKNCLFINAISYSSTTASTITYSSIQLGGGLNTTCVSMTGTGTIYIRYTRLESGSSSAISVGNGCTVDTFFCSIDSTNTNAITGAGSLIYSGLTFTNTSKTINVTTQTGGILPGGVFQAPSAGFIGEQIRSVVLQGSAVALVSNTAKTVTSISLTPGIWDISALICYSGASLAVATISSISTTNNTQGGSVGDNEISSLGASTASGDISLSIPQYRATVTATTTYYMIAQSNFSGSQNAYGRLCATRVG